MRRVADVGADYSGSRASGGFYSAARLVARFALQPVPDVPSDLPGGASLTSSPSRPPRGRRETRPIAPQPQSWVS